MEEFHSDLTAIWHSFSAPLHLYRNLARIQPAGNQLSWVPSYKGVCCGWFLFIIADWYSSVLRMCLFINSMTGILILFYLDMHFLIFLSCCATARAAGLKTQVHGCVRFYSPFNDVSLEKLRDSQRKMLQQIENTRLYGKNFEIQTLCNVILF